MVVLFQIVMITYVQRSVAPWLAGSGERTWTKRAIDAVCAAIQKCVPKFGPEIGSAGNHAEKIAHGSAWNHAQRPAPAVSASNFHMFLSIATMYLC